MKKRWVGFAVAIMVLSLVPALSFGQVTSGTIFGTVTDAQGAAVQNATVTVTDLSKGTTDTATTNDSGNYTVTHLIPDPYSVKIEAQGFQTFQQTGITVVADATQRVNAQMQVGSTSQTVEVTGEAPQLQTDNADVGVSYNERYVENLPVFNRNFTAFELLSPGTQQLAGWNHAATENPQGGLQIFVNGQHFSGTGFQLDGTDNQDPILGIIVINPNLDAITQATVGSQFYDAEQGKAIAGLVTAQTKSGTNAFHGSAFWFRRTDANLARDPFTQSTPNSITGRFIPSDKWNQYGGTIGGPIIKNKLFFFGDYQGTKETTGVTNVLTVPTTQVVQSCTAATGFCNLSQYLGHVSGGGTIPNPMPGGPPISIMGGQVFLPSVNNTGNGYLGAINNLVPNNMIPVADLSPQAVAILKDFPAPTNDGLTSNYVASGAGSFKQNSFDTRIDYNINDKNQLYGRFSLAYFNLSGAPSLGALGGNGFGPGPGLAGSSDVHNYSLASGWTHTFSPTFLMDLHLGWFRYNPQTAFWDQGQTPATGFGIPGLNLPSQPLLTSGLPYFNLGGNNGTGNQTISDFGNGLGVQRCNCPLTERENQYQAVINFTKIRGNHTFKFGADVRYATNLRVPSDQNRAGQLTFSQNGTGDGNVGGMNLATFLFGDVTSFSRFVSSVTDATDQQWRMFYYGQDTWRVTPKLTLSYGLRWEVYFPESVNGKGNGGFYNIVEGVGRVAGYGPYGLNGNIGNDWHAFAPRIGLAYQLYEKTVIRAGFGVSYDMGVFGSNFGHSVAQSLPVLLSQQVNATGASNNYAPAFNLGPGGYLGTLPGVVTGAPAGVFPAIPASGQLPLLGPTNNAQPYIRPLTQTLPAIGVWNLTIQQQIGKNSTLEMAYIGNLGRHGFAGDGPSYNVNQQFANGSYPLQGKFTYPGYIDPATGKTLVCCNTGVNNYLGNNANSSYNALQAKFNQNFSNGLQFITHLTWSRALHYDSNYFADVQSVAYGPDDQNRNLVWVFSGVYNFPFCKGAKYANGVSGWMNEVIGGWQLSFTNNWASGLPFTPTLSSCPGNSSGVCRPDNGLNRSSFQLGPSGLIHPPGGGNPYVQYFTPVAVGGAWLNPATGTIGNAGFDALYGPSDYTAQAAIMKDFQLTERFRFQFRMDAYNIFNHVALGYSQNQGGGGSCVAFVPGSNCGNGGQIQDILFGTTMRQLQFGLHLFF
jgi:Carboxypeptidase regulatory-like domain/TonB dependent receptor